MVHDNKGAKPADIPLGRETLYPKAFDPGLLFAIPRNQARQSLGIGQTAPFVGYDEWTLYELSWLDASGSPQVSIGLLRIPADSEFIVESKSLKLYTNSLYYQRFKSAAALVDRVRQDLNKLLKAHVRLELLKTSDALSLSDNRGYQSIDHFAIRPSDHPDTGLLKGQPLSDGISHFKTERFRSLCPVTAQPDWASIYIQLQGVEINAANLAQYLAGYSEHQGFHESCVERIYMELNEHLAPTELSVAARYTRRGGIDINPVRASSEQFLAMPGRELRQ